MLAVGDTVPDTNFLALQSGEHSVAKVIETAALTKRVTELPPLAKLAAKAKVEYGDAYCGGDIEASLRKVLKA